MDNSLANASERDKQRNFLYLIYGLYVVTIFTAGLAALIGVIIAYAKRDSVTDENYSTHIPYLIRTFWGSLFGFVGVPILLMFLSYVVEFPLFFLYPLVGLTGLWYLFRVIFGLVRLIDNRAVNPYGWLA
jgi:dnaJ domain protein